MPSGITMVALTLALLTQSAIAARTSTRSREEVLGTHETFRAALKAGDLATLASLYSDDYMLVRPDGSVLSKDEVLRDFRTGGLTFESIDLTDARVRVYGDTAVLSGE